MVEPLKFRDRIPEMVGGRDGVLATARDMLRTTHPLTRASDPSRIERDSARRHVVETVLAAVQARLREPLAALLDDKVREVREEIYFLEGEDHSRDLRPEIHEALRGEVWGDGGVLSETEYESAVRTCVDAAAMASTILAKPITDKARALAAVGVTTDIEALVDEATAPPAEGTHASDRTEPYFSAPSRGLRVDLPSGDDGIALTTISHFAAAEQLRQLTGEDHGPWTTVEGEDFDLSRSDAKWFAGPSAAVLFRDGERREDWVDVEDRIERERKTIAPVEMTRKRGRALAEGEEQTPLARAMVAALDVLCEQTSMTEAEVAGLVGVSRAQMNNYRKGKTAWEPTGEQRYEIKETLRQRAAMLEEAVQEILTAEDFVQLGV